MLWNTCVTVTLVPLMRVCVGGCVRAVNVVGIVIIKQDLEGRGGQNSKLATSRASGITYLYD